MATQMVNVTKAVMETQIRKQAALITDPAAQNQMLQLLGFVDVFMAIRTDI